MFPCSLSPVKGNNAESFTIVINRKRPEKKSFTSKHYLALGGIAIRKAFCS
jgi:hypothetical protein